MRGVAQIGGNEPHRSRLVTRGFQKILREKASYPKGEEQKSRIQWGELVGSFPAEYTLGSGS